MAAEYPDTFFGLLDVQVEGVPNVVSSSYREHEAAFLLGALGGYLTKTNQIGFIGGVSGVIQTVSSTDIWPEHGIPIRKSR